MVLPREALKFSASISEGVIADADAVNMKEAISPSEPASRRVRGCFMPEFWEHAAWVPRGDLQSGICDRGAGTASS